MTVNIIPDKLTLREASSDAFIDGFPVMVMPYLFKPRLQLLRCHFPLLISRAKLT